MAVSRTWLAARPPRRRRPNRHRRPDAEATGSTAIARQAQGLRGGERRERRSSDPGHLKGGALGGYGDYARPERSGPDEPRRPRKGSPVGDGATADGLLERPRPDAYGGRPWRRAREMSAGTNTESPYGGRSRLSRRHAEREGCGSRVTRRVWRGAAGTPHPLLVHGSASRPNRGEPCGRGRGVPGTWLHVRSASVDTRSPPESRPRPVARNPGVAFREADRDCLEDRSDA
jgi:hypothetical protein